MKTTLELPDELYLEVKSQAALRRRKIKDYVAEGLRLVLAKDRAAGEHKGGAIAVFDEIRRTPLHQSSDLRAWIEQTDSERKAHWRDEA